MLSLHYLRGAGITSTRIALAVVMLVLASPYTIAQTGFSFAPMLITLSLAPGGSTVRNIVVNNADGVRAAEFLVYLADITQGPDGEYSVVPAGSTSRSAVPWIKLSNQRIRVNPGQTFEVGVAITVPRGALGGRYAAVVLELVEDTVRSQGAVASSVLIPRVVVPVEISVQAPAVRRSLAVTAFSAQTGSENTQLRSSYGQNALMLSAEVSNDGDTHVFARGSLIIRDNAGRRLRQIPLGGGRGIVLPGASVALTSVLPSGLPPGDYLGDIYVDYGGIMPARARVAFTVSTGGSQSQEIQNFGTVAPLVVNEQVLHLNYPAGATAAKALVLENKSDKPMLVEARAVPFRYDSEGELVIGDDQPSVGSCADWIELRPSVFEVKPRSRQVVRTVISIPKDAAGGYYASLEFTGSPVEEDWGPAETKWASTVGTLIFLIVGKETQVAADTLCVDAMDSGNELGWAFEAVFANTGTIHVKPSVFVAIRRHVLPQSSEGLEYVGQGWWELVNSANLGEVATYVLPGGTRTLRVEYPARLEPGRYRVEYTVAYGGEAPLLGTTEFIVEP